MRGRAPVRGRSGRRAARQRRRSGRRRSGRGGGRRGGGRRGGGRRGGRQRGGADGDGQLVGQAVQQQGVAADRLLAERLLVAGRHAVGVGGGGRGLGVGGPAGGPAHDVLLEHRPHRPGVAVVMADELLRGGEIQPAGQERQFPRILRQTMHLPVVPQLQGVLHGPQEVVAGGEAAVLVGPQQPVIGQPGEGVQRAGGPHARPLPAVHQLQALGGELDIADAARPALHLAPAAAGVLQFRLDPLLAPPHAGPDLLGGQGVDQRLGVLQELPAELPVAGDRPGLQQRLPLPRAGVLL